MNHQRASELINAFLDGELTNAEARELQTHLDGCPSCSAELSGLRRLSGNLHSLSVLEAPSALRSRVADAIGGAASARPLAWKWWPAFALVLLLLVVLIWPSGSANAENALARTDSAMAHAQTIHMVCKWYKPENRRETFIQRELWLGPSRGRWNEANGTSAILELGAYRVLQQGTGVIPSSAGSVVRERSLEPMLVGLARLHGSGVRLEHPSPISWQGRTYDVVLARDTDKDGSPLRTIFMIDPSTYLPVHGELQKQVDGRWVPEALMQFEFNKRIDPAVFSL